MERPLALTSPSPPVTYSESPPGLCCLNERDFTRQVSLRLACLMRLEHMPFDTQTCPLVLGLYTSLASDVSAPHLERDLVLGLKDLVKVELGDLGAVAGAGAVR